MRLFTKKRNLVCAFALLCATFFWQARDAVAAIGGNGTSSDPYTINNLDDYKTFKSYITQGKNIGDNIFWKLTTNISGANIDGRTSAAFSGVFDGGGYTISVLSGSYNDNYVGGLFGLTRNATIKNVKITFGYIDGSPRTGGLIGEAQGTLHVDNVHINGRGPTYAPWRWGGLIGLMYQVTTVTISNTSVYYSTVRLDDVNCGGLIGNIIGTSATNITITDCSAEIYFTTEKNYVGGIIGSIEKNGGTITLRRVFSGVRVLGIGSGEGRGRIVGYLAPGTTCNLIAVQNNQGSKYFGIIKGTTVKLIVL